MVQDKTKPFFLYFASLAPHAPYQAPKADEDRYASTIKDPTRRTYAAMITSLDDQVGRIVAALEKRGLRENTLIIFSSDNGGPRSAVVASGAHSKEERDAGGVKQESLPASNGELRGGKGSLHEGGVRVPTIFNWPARLKPRVVNEPLHMVDIMPTALALAGAKANPADKPLDGVDIWATVAEGKAWPHDDILVNVEAFRGAVIKGKWKLVKIALLPGKTELFDLAADPGEKNDVATQNPEIVRDLEARLIAYAKQQKPSEWLKVQSDYLGAQGKTLFDPDFDIDDAGLPHLKPVLPRSGPAASGVGVRWVVASRTGLAALEPRIALARDSHAHPMISRDPTLPGDGLSLVRDDLLFRLQRRVGLIPAEGLGLVRRAVFWSLLAWAPIAVWAWFTGRAIGGAGSEPLLAHFGVHVRFLVAVPLLILAEGLLHSLTTLLLPQFVRSGLIPEAALPRFREALSGIARLRNATLPWIAIVALALAMATIPEIANRGHELDWAAETGGASPHLGFGGWWLLYVGRPIYLVLVLGWLWRVVLLALLFARIAGLGLSIVPTHPDRLGGLGFVERIPVAFAPVVLAIGAVLAARWTHDVVYHAVDPLSLRVEMGAFVIVAVAIFAAPSLALSGCLRRAKKQALLEYGALVGDARSTRARALDRGQAARRRRAPARAGDRPGRRHAGGLRRREADAHGAARQGLDRAARACRRGADDRRARDEGAGEEPAAGDPQGAHLDQPARRRARLGSGEDRWGYVVPVLASLRPARSLSAARCTRWGPPRTRPRRRPRSTARGRRRRGRSRIRGCRSPRRTAPTASSAAGAAAST